MKRFKTLGLKFLTLLLETSKTMFRFFVFSNQLLTNVFIRKELATLLNTKLVQYKDEQIQSEAVAEIPNIQTIRLPFLTFAIGRDDSSEMNSINDNIS